MTSLFKTQRLENRHTLFSNTYPSRPASRPDKLVPTLPTLVLVNNAYIFCNKPNFVTAMTRRALPSTVLNMAREKKKRAPKSVCYRFHRKTETDYAPTLCVIPRNKAVLRTNQGMDDCAAGGISEHSV